jgi:uncharacterized membrane protein YfcA
MLELFLLFMAAFAAAAISGAAGFGGALLLLPLLATTVGAVQAVPLLTVAQFVGNVSRAGFGFRQIRWKPVALFLAGAAPLSVAGAMSFVTLPKDLVTRCIGAAILLFVALKYYGVLDLKPGPLLLAGGGGIVGFLSGWWAAPGRWVPRFSCRWDCHRFFCGKRGGDRPRDAWGQNSRIPAIHLPRQRVLG